MDDGSTDDTEAIVAPYVATGRVTYDWTPNTGSPVAPRNRALLRVQAPYVVFFDSDDVMRAGYLSRALEIFDAHPTWSALVSDYRNFSESGEAPITHLATCATLQSAFRACGGGEVLELLRRNAHLTLVDENFALTSSIVFRTATVKALRGFDESLRFSEDFDLLWRAATLAPIGVSTAVGCGRRIHDGNVSKQGPVILAEKVLSRERLWAAESDPEIARALRRSIARFTSAHAIALMPTRRIRAVFLAARALRLGASVGVWPTGVLKAFLKSVLGRTP